MRLFALGTCALEFEEVEQLTWKRLGFLDVVQEVCVSLRFNDFL